MDACNSCKSDLQLSLISQKEKPASFRPHSHHVLLRIRRPFQDLLLYLLQLVQALKYEDFDGIKAGLDSSVHRKEPEMLSSISQDV